MCLKKALLEEPIDPTKTQNSQDSNQWVTSVETRIKYLFQTSFFSILEDSDWNIVVYHNKPKSTLNFSSFEANVYRPRQNAHWQKDADD